MNKSYTEEQKNIEGMMINLMKELSKMAPHPDYPQYKGPLFAQTEDHIKPAAEYDGMLGSIAFESFLGSAFAGASTAQTAAPSGASTFFAANDWMDVSSEYMQDRAPVRLGQKRAITGTFNHGVTRPEMMQAYLADLPRRMGIERSIAHQQRKLYALQKKALETGMAYAA